MKFESAHDIGAEVAVRFFGTQPSVPGGVVTGVHFAEGKVTYDIQLTLGGEPLRNVDGTFLEPMPRSMRAKKAA